MKITEFNFMIRKLWPMMKSFEKGRNNTFTGQPPLAVIYMLHEMCLTLPISQMTGCSYVYEEII